jgi:hypothetical protein
MLQSTWGLLKTAVGGSALGMLLWKARAGNTVSPVFRNALVGLEISAGALLLICGLSMLYKKQFILALLVLGLGAYVLALSIIAFQTPSNDVTSDFTFYPFAVSNVVLVVMGMMKLMRRA